MTLDFDNTLSSATRIGHLSSNVDLRFTGSIDGNSGSGFDKVDFYTFTLAQASSVIINLKDMVQDGNLFLFSDVNQDGQFNPAQVSHKHDLIASSLKLNAENESLRLDGLGAGRTYFIAIDGLDTRARAAATPYTLEVKTLPGAGSESFSDPTLVSRKGNGENILLNGGRLYQGNVSFSSDTSDRYRFRVETPSQLNGTLAGLQSDANLSLFSVLPDGRRTLIKKASAGGTTIDTVIADNAATGDYEIEVTKNGTGSTPYILNLSGQPIQRAQMGIRIERVTTNGNFGETPDFVARATIDGTRKETRQITSRDALFNQTLAQGVALNKRFIPIQISVVDEDPGFDDVADLNPFSGKRDLRLTYDSLLGEISSDDAALGFRKEGETIVVTGDGEGDGKATTIRFSLNYDSFGFGSTSTLRSLNTASTRIGKTGSDRIIGENKTGIIDGRGGHDNLSGMGGHDVLIGGIGNDRLNGGIGRDTLWGGSGHDVYTGGSSRDTFVLDLGAGVDIIKDFRNGMDKLGLHGGLPYEILDIVRDGKHVGIFAGKDKLAVLRNVRADQITAADFAQIDFTHIKGITTPYAVA